MKVDKSILQITSISIVVLMFLAVFAMPYGYYTFLRIMTTLSSGLFIYVYYCTKSLKPWSIIFVFIGVTFNPLFPVHLDRDIWFILNILVGCVYLGNLLLIKKL